MHAESVAGLEEDQEVDHLLTRICNVIKAFPIFGRFPNWDYELDPLWKSGVPNWETVT